MDAIEIKLSKTMTENICFGCERKFCKEAMVQHSCVFEGTPWVYYLCESCQKATEELDWWEAYGFGSLHERALEIEKAKINEGADDA